MQVILLQAPTNQIFSIALWIGIIVIFYFFMIRPQQQKQKEQKRFIENLKKGDAVVTIGGLHGRVVSVEGTSVVLEVDRGVKLTFDKTAISRESVVKTETTKE